MTAEQMQPEAWVWLARIRRVQGRKGEVLADLLTDFPEKFAERKRVWLIPERLTSAEPRSGEPREVEVKAHWLPKGGHSGDVVLHFSGVDSIEDAEKLRNLFSMRHYNATSCGDYYLHRKYTCIRTVRGLVSMQAHLGCLPYF